jgi:predicted regulator of Ras-like GTPase activity (Roadblock/LC7/MglB family)
MEHVLEDLNKTPGLIGSFVVDSDGIIVVSDVAAGADAEQASALISALTNAANKSLSRLAAGTLTSAFFELDEQKVLLQATDVGHLVALAEPDANLGLLRLELRQAARRLAAESIAR